ncbi:MAG: LytTR family DNA-binding domain-containing protein, partial [Bacteroidia bacterium]|nr:LytTR family DNA-binding domain-containing protein [Bacteroidia bacterium]
DDPIASRILEEYVRKVEILELVKNCSNGEEALFTLAQTQIDLIFLDVEMPGISGMEILKSLAIMPFIIITTSKPDYAVEAFEFQVNDYLVKPISPQRFIKSIERVRQEWENRIQNSSPTLANQPILIKHNREQIKLEPSQINYFKAVGDYIEVHTNEKKYLIYNRIKNLSASLGFPFVRCHRSHIVNVNKIQKIDEQSVILDNGTILPVSKAMQENLLKSFRTLE